jgi:putative alpha-1,2-mannosidase
MAATPLTFTASTSKAATALSYPFFNETIPAQAGALVSVQGTSVTVRFGVSMISSAQACANAEAEVPSWDFGAVQAASAGAWEGVLEKVVVDVAKERSDVVELLYSSVRASLASGEGGRR